MIPRAAVLEGSSEVTSIFDEEALGRIHEEKITSGLLQMSSMIHDEPRGWG